MTTKKKKKKKLFWKTCLISFIFSRLEFWAAGQQSPCLLCNWKVHYHVHNVQPLDPILIHIIIPYFLWIILKLSVYWCLDLLFSVLLNKFLHMTLLFAKQATCSIHLILPNLNLKLLIMQLFPSSSYFVHSNLKNSTQPPVFNHIQIVFFPESVTNCHTYTKIVHLYEYKAAPLIHVLPYSFATNLPHDLDRSVPKSCALNMCLLPFLYLHLFHFLRKVCRSWKIRTT